MVNRPSVKRLFNALCNFAAVPGALLYCPPHKEGYNTRSPSQRFLSISATPCNLLCAAVSKKAVVKLFIRGETQ